MSPYIFCMLLTLVKPYVRKYLFDCSSKITLKFNPANSVNFVTVPKQLDTTVHWKIKTE